MAEVIADESKKLVGTEAEPVVFEIEKGTLRRFADAIEDHNPLWRDEEYAKKSKYGCMVAPPCLPCTTVAGFTGRIKIDLPLKGIVASGDKLEILRPLRVGDVIICNQKLVSLRERKSKKGTRVYVTFENIFTDQNGEIVAKGQASYVRF